MSFKKRPQKLSPEAKSWIDSAPVQSQPTNPVPQPPQPASEQEEAAPQAPEVATLVETVITRKPRRASGGGVKKTTIELPVDLYREFKKLTVLEETTMREVVVGAIERWVQQKR